LILQVNLAVQINLILKLVITIRFSKTKSISISNKLMNKLRVRVGN